MSGLRSFLLCLAPAVLAYILVLAGKDQMINAAVPLIVMGGVISGLGVAISIHRSMEPKNEVTGLKVFLGILAFLGIGVGYLALGMAGCCGVAMLSDSLR